MDACIITTNDAVGSARRSQLDLDLPGISISFVHTDKREAITEFGSELNNYLNATRGCLTTHLSAQQKFVVSKSEWALFLEDDFRILQKSDLIDLIAKIKKYNARYPMIIQVGWTELPLTPRRLIAAVLNFVRLKGKVKGDLVEQTSRGTHAYIMNQHMAKIMLEFLSSSEEKLAPPIIPLDIYWILCSTLYMVSGCKMYRTNKSFLTQFSETSLITPNNVYKDKRLFRAIPYRSKIESLSSMKKEPIKIRELLLQEHKS